MFPYINDFFEDIGLDNYLILMVVGIFAGLFCFRIFASKLGMQPSAYNFYLLNGLLSVAFGLFSAMLFQSIYNYAESGVFEFRGMTVMGGILGAALFFIFFTWALCRTDYAKKYKPEFWTAVNLIIPCIVIAHFFGRLGCFCAGCCYGRETDSVIGLIFIKGFYPDGTRVMHPHPRLPTQLFEAAFLLALFVAMVVVMFKFKRKDLTALIYLYAYPSFRFIIEIFRDDERGAFFFGLSPSQLLCVGLLAVGVLLTILIYRYKIIPFKPKTDQLSHSDEQSVT